MKGFILLISIWWKCIFALELPFCHENEIKNEFATTDITAALFLNASYDAIASGFPDEEAHGKEYCTCKVYATEPIETLRIQPKYYASDSVASECKKRVDVISHNGQLTAFNCKESGTLQISHIEAGQYIQFHLRATDGFTLVSEDLDRFVICIGPEVQSVLKVICNAPFDPWVTMTPMSTSSTTSSSMSTATSTTLTPSTKTHPKSSTNQSVIIAGVIVGLGLTLLFMITCLLCYIARRKKKEEKDQSHPQKVQVNTRTGFHYRLRRTITDIRDKIRTRPLPNIPLPSRKLTRQAQSGIYCSIRSEAPPTGQGQDGITGSRSKVTKQESCDSVGSYLEPFSISRPGDMYIIPVGSQKGMSGETQRYVNAAMKKFPVSVNSKSQTGKAQESKNDTSQNAASPETKHVNHSGTPASPGHEGVVQNGVKVPLVQVDSHGYMPMKTDLRKLLGEHSVNCSTKIGNEQPVSVLKREHDDSFHSELFPDLIRYEEENSDVTFSDEHKPNTAERVRNVRYVKQNDPPKT